MVYVFILYGQSLVIGSNYTDEVVVFISFYYYYFLSDPFTTM